MKIFSVQFVFYFLHYRNHKVQDFQTAGLHQLMANKQEYFRAIGELLTATLRLKGRDVTVTQKL